VFETQENKLTTEKSIQKFLISHGIIEFVARGGVVVKALRYNRQVSGSIPDVVIGIFQ
jgi:hypothetical protein